jgi:hypothetical protein
MASKRRGWHQRQAEEHEELADAERYLARALQGLGAEVQARRHLIDAALHELRAGEFFARVKTKRS